jgi:hypothetical protein
VEPHTGNIGSPRSDKDDWLSSWLLGVDVAGAHDGSWNHLCFTCLYLPAKPSHRGEGDVDELVCFLHHPMVCGCRTREQSFLIGAALSHHAVVGGAAFSGEKLTFTRAYLSNVRVIMAIMHAPLVK